MKTQIPKEYLCVNVDLDDVVNSLEQLRPDEIIDIIKRLDKSTENWDATKELADYFNSEVKKCKCPGKVTK